MPLVLPHQPSQQRAEAGRSGQRRSQTVQVLFVHQQRRTLEATVTIVETEPHRPAARGFSFVVLQELDGRLVVLSGVGGLLDDLAGAPVISERSGERTVRWDMGGSLPSAPGELRGDALGGLLQSAAQTLDRLRYLLLADEAVGEPYPIFPLAVHIESATVHVGHAELPRRVAEGGRVDRIRQGEPEEEASLRPAPVGVAAAAFVEGGEDDVALASLAMDHLLSGALPQPRRR